jgi:hypothetical protein
MYLHLLGDRHGNLSVQAYNASGLVDKSFEKLAKYIYVMHRKTTEQLGWTLVQIFCSAL